MGKLVLQVGEARITPIVRKGCLESIGAIKVGKTALRHPRKRFLPWFDSYGGQVFDRFALRGVESRGEDRLLDCTALSTNDYPFRERRDSSGDVCLRNVGWDAPPVSAEFRIGLAPAAATIDGRSFTGFRYWFEYDSANTAIHRLVDRQTWEVGGALTDQAICARNWLTPPRFQLGRDVAYSTVGLDQWCTLLPGNLWARWSLLAGFDLTYGAAGVLVGWYDRVSCIRTVIEKTAGEDCLRFVDLHYFPESRQVVTNPKTILWCPDRLDETDALNLWTRLTDRDRDLGCQQFGITRDGPPEITFCKNRWFDFHFDRDYEDVLDAAAELGADRVFIDPVWEHGEAYNMALRRLIPEGQRHGTVVEKRFTQNMCCTLDFEVSEEMGGEAALKRLCARAAARNVRIISWMATHLSPCSYLREKPGALAHGKFGVFAAKESGLHPDTGYPGDCWTVNLNGPLAERLKTRILEICTRTGLSGFLWDSFSNLGWWQVDYSDGSLRPQCEAMARLYAELTEAGLYLMPEGLAAFSNHNCIGQHGGDIYQGALTGYAYNSVIGFHDRNDRQQPPHDEAILRGREPITALFRAFAHRWIPNSNLWRVPRAEWDAESAQQIKALYAVYKKVRGQMQQRTVLKGDVGVVWADAKGGRVCWSFQDQAVVGAAADALTGEPCVDGRLLANRVYELGAGATLPAPSLPTRQ